MDLATLIGLIGAFATIAIVMVLDGGSPIELFAVPQAIVLIVSGSLMATLITAPLKSFLTLPKLIGIAIKDQKYEFDGAIELISKMADKARREGLLALEEESKKVSDPFLQKGIMLVVDGVDPAQVRAILETNIEHMEERHRALFGMFAAAGGFAPTFGIIGTVMGLINVLKQMDDPGKLTKAIASAFLATLWGLMVANVIYLPLGSKLKVKSEEEVAYRTLLMEGILSLQAGENPRIVREKLSAFLPPSVAGKEKKPAAADAKGKAPQDAKGEA
jgi:chemotaxis protein MotA